jgi:hypothetical protein
MAKESHQDLTDDEIARRRDEALRRALGTRPKPHEAMKIGKVKKRKASPSASANASSSKAAKKPSR